ncbi:DedA family protein [Amnibacterium endophyticum]|uniref:DedA family protein n=1 Tax=Amnibacterium endophyticum TaxID=2109337 RepID=A0ABW4LFW3_9MICO
MFCETSLFIGLLVPGDTVVLLASSGNDGWGQWGLMLAAVVVGSLAGESVGWAIGRFFGERLRLSRIGRRIGERQVLRAQRWMDRRGGVAILLSRFLPIMHALMPVTAGAGGFPYGRFMAWTTPACVAWALLYVSVGTAAGSGYRQFVGQVHSVGWIVLGALVLFLVAVALGKRLLHRVDER